MASRLTGATLLELVIGGVMLLTLLGVLGSLILPSLRSSQSGMARSWMQQQCFLALDRVADDVQRTATQGLTVAAQQVGMVRLLDVSPESAQVWERKVVLYTCQPATRLLVRQLVPCLEATNADATAPNRLDPARLAALAQQQGPEVDYRELAHDVTRFDVQADTTRQPDCPVTLTLQVERRTQGRDPERFQATRVVSVRNRP